MMSVDDLTKVLRYLIRTLRLRDVSASDGVAAVLPKQSVVTLGQRGPVAVKLLDSNIHHHHVRQRLSVWVWQYTIRCRSCKW